MDQHELPGIPPAPTTEAKVGSPAWIRSEFSRFLELAREHDGLVTAHVAALRLGVSRQRVHQLIETGALARYQVLGKFWLSGSEVEWFAGLQRTNRFRYDDASAVA